MRRVDAVIEFFVDLWPFLALAGMIALLTLVVGYVIWDMRPIEGEVKNKVFTAAHYETHFHHHCTDIPIGKGRKVQSCTDTPYQVWVNDAWQINVCDKERCKWVNLTETQYGDIKVGNHFSEK